MEEKIGVAQKAYGNSSIKSLKGADRVRYRPAVMLGSDGIDGAFHTVKEIIGNSTDEARAGHGKVIEVTLLKDGGISVRDYGRGVPMDWNEDEGRFNWQLVFDELYAGGKYDVENADYDCPVGLNGLGATAVQYTSKYMHVISVRENMKFIMDFEEGVSTHDLIKEPQGEMAGGTYIAWRPDLNVFTNTDITFGMLKEFCEGQAHVNGIDFALFNEANPAENVTINGRGLKHYLEDKLGDKIIELFDNSNASKEIKTISGVTLQNKPYNARIDFILAFTTECKAKRYYFHNTAKMHGGVHEFAFSRVFDNFFKAIGKQHDVQIQPYDYNDYISVAISTYSNITSFANQTKDSISNDFINALVEKAVLGLITELNEKGNSTLKLVIGEVVNRAAARKAAKEAELLARTAKKAVSVKKVFAPEKFVDCRSKDVAQREVYLPEGDSAAGSCKDARDANVQAIFPVRGKLINCLKAPIEKILQNGIVTDLFTVLGCGLDIPGADNLFDLSKLNFNKVIICTDADYDGYQIRMLFLCMFFRLAPELLRQGYVYVAETPLFEIETSGKNYFAYTPKEYDEITADLKSKNIRINKISRSKGLGENNADMMHLTTMSQNTRRLTQWKIDVDDPAVYYMTNMLFGKDTGKERKEFLMSTLGFVDANAVEACEELEALDAEAELEVEL